MVWFKFRLNGRFSLGNTQHPTYGYPCKQSWFLKVSLYYYVYVYVYASSEKKWQWQGQNLSLNETEGKND